MGETKRFGKISKSHKHIHTKSYNNSNSIAKKFFSSYSYRKVFLGFSIIFSLARFVRLSNRLFAAHRENYLLFSQFFKYFSCIIQILFILFSPMTFFICSKNYYINCSCENPRKSLENPLEIDVKKSMFFCFVFSHTNTVTHSPKYNENI